MQTTVQLTKFTAIQLYYSKLLLLLSISVPVNLPFPILIRVYMLFDLSLQSTRFVQTTVQLTKFTAIQLYYSKLLLLLSISVPVNLPFPILIHVCMLFNLSLPSTCFVQTTVQLTKFTAIQLFASGNNVV